MKATKIYRVIYLIGGVKKRCFVRAESEWHAKEMIKGEFGGKVLHAMEENTRFFGFRDLK